MRALTFKLQLMEVLKTLNVLLEKVDVSADRRKKKLLLGKAATSRSASKMNPRLSSMVDKRFKQKSFLGKGEKGGEKKAILQPSGSKMQVGKFKIQALQSTAVSAAPAATNDEDKVAKKSVTKGDSSSVTEEFPSSLSVQDLMDGLRISNSGIESVSSRELDNRLEEIQNKFVCDSDGSASVISKEESADGRWDRLRNKLLADNQSVKEEESRSTNVNTQYEETSPSNFQPRIDTLSKEQECNHGLQVETSPDPMLKVKPYQTNDDDEKTVNSQPKQSREEMESNMLSNIISSRYSKTWVEGVITPRRRRTRLRNFEDSKRQTGLDIPPTPKSPALLTSQSMLTTMSGSQKVPPINSTISMGADEKIAPEQAKITVTTVPSKPPVVTSDSFIKVEEEIRKSTAAKHRQNASKESESDVQEELDCIEDSDKPRCVEQKRTISSISPITVEGMDQHFGGPDSGSASIGEALGCDGSVKSDTLNDILLATTGTDEHEQDSKGVPLPMLGNVLSSLSESCASHRTMEKVEKLKALRLRKSVTGSTLPEEDSHTLTPTSAFTKVEDKRDVGRSDLACHTNRGPKIEVTLVSSSSQDEKSEPEESVHKSTNGTKPDGASVSPEEVLCTLDAGNTSGNCEAAANEKRLQDAEPSLFDVDSTSSDSSESTGSESQNSEVEDSGMKKQAELTVLDPDTPRQDKSDTDSATSFDFKAINQFKSVKSFDEKEGTFYSEDNPSWRLDPSTSHSDWKIEVERKDSGEVDIYNVHRHVLAVGPRTQRIPERDFFLQRKETAVSALLASNWKACQQIVSRCCWISFTVTTQI